MELGLLELDELVEILAHEFYSIQGYQLPPDRRMQSSTNQAEKSCVAMALFTIQKFYSIHSVLENTQELTDTQKVIDWFRQLDKDQIKRIQDYIINKQIEMYDFVRPRTSPINSVWRVIDIKNDFITAEKVPQTLEPKQIERVEAKSDFFVLLDEEDDDY